MKLSDKVLQLENFLKDTESCTIAFSGGADSSLLLAAALRFVSGKVLAVTASPPYEAASELICARATAEELGAAHLVLPMAIPQSIRRNPPERCYLCKREIFSRIIKAAGENGIEKVFDGSNIDDLSEYRPGLKALKELGVKSPLAQCGFTKEEVRTLAKEWGIRVWNKPSNSCLLTRFPHDEEIDEQQFEKIEKAEVILKKYGFNHVRVRHHGIIARIELLPDEISGFCRKETFESVNTEIRRLGYSHVCLDLKGYIKWKP